MIGDKEMQFSARETNTSSWAPQWRALLPRFILFRVQRKRTDLQNPGLPLQRPSPIGQHGPLDEECLHGYSKRRMCSMRAQTQRRGMVLPAVLANESGCEAC